MHSPVSGSVALAAIVAAALACPRPAPAATLTRAEMHLRVLREDNGTSGEMTLLGPIRLSATR